MSGKGRGQVSPCKNRFWFLPLHHNLLFVLVATSELDKPRLTQEKRPLFFIFPSSFSTFCCLSPALLRCYQLMQTMTQIKQSCLRPALDETMLGVPKGCWLQLLVIWLSEIWCKQPEPPEINRWTKSSGVSCAAQLWSISSVIGQLDWKNDFKLKKKKSAHQRFLQESRSGGWCDTH